jgi:hypothetical protein
MAMPKVWAAFERLTAADLNAAFEWLRGRSEAVPGVQVSGSGPVGLTAEATLDLTTVANGNAAILNAANDRLVIPAGKGGLWRFGTWVTVNNIAATERHILTLKVNGTAVASSYLFPSSGTAIAAFLDAEVIVVAGDLITLTGTSSVAADWVVTRLVARLVSLGGLV